MHLCTLYEKLDNQRVRCQACAHYCLIEKDDVGICAVRYNDDGELFLGVYGRPVAVHLDPIEKKPFYHFLPGAQIFSLGTIGCNFGCDFCQNWDISTLKLEPAQIKTQNWSVEMNPKRIVNHCLKNKIPAIAYTYNEPTIFAEYVFEVASLAKERGLKNVLVSNGYQSKESLNYLAPVIDAINIDLKSWNEKFYLQICKAKLSVVKENIKLWKEKGVWVELTTLLIPGRNDDEKEIAGMAGFIAEIDQGLPWHLSRFFPQYKMADGQITPFKTLLDAYKIGKKAGLKYIYVGNAEEADYEKTACARCGKIVIDRRGFSVLENNLKNGRCPQCGERIEGIWTRPKRII